MRELRLHKLRRGTWLRRKSGGKTAALQKMRRSLVALSLLKLAFAELEALEFSGGGFGKFLQELNPARALVAADAFGDEILQFAGQSLVGREFLFQDYVGGGLGEAGFVVAGDDGGFEYGGVREQGAFNFRGT